MKFIMQLLCLALLLPTVLLIAPEAVSSRTPPGKYSMGRFSFDQSLLTQNTSEISLLRSPVLVLSLPHIHYRGQSSLTLNRSLQKIGGGKMMLVVNVSLNYKRKGITLFSLQVLFLVTEPLTNVEVQLFNITYDNIEQNHTTKFPVSHTIRCCYFLIGWTDSIDTIGLVVNTPNETNRNYTISFASKSLMDPTEWMEVYFLVMDFSADDCRRGSCEYKKDLQSDSRNANMSRALIFAPKDILFLVGLSTMESEQGYFHYDENSFHAETQGISKLSYSAMGFNMTCTVGGGIVAANNDPTVKWDSRLGFLLVLLLTIGAVAY